MSNVRFEKKTFRLSPLGRPNPLPDFANVAYVRAPVEWDDSLTAEDTKYWRYGRVGTILPYRSQDDYKRNLGDVQKDVVILENAHVRAEFLPWMGGRLWSLICDGREMLSVNPVVQPCHLAIRDAWCSGGVEWNMGIRGHSMFTNEPLFTELLRLPDGTCGVRFYEFDRVRGTTFRIEGYLPPDSKMLLMQMRIENPVGNGETPMYWWSNIAVPELAGTRVITSAPSGILSLYIEGKYFMLREKMPEYLGMDTSRPTEIANSLDVFYDMPEGQRPYITALQDGKRGLVHISTKKLGGRKLFVWGMGAGGRHWQKFLSDGNTSYIEIQAGLAKTQQDHLPMPEGETWTWLEAYGELQCDVNGMDWEQAGKACAKATEELLPLGALEREQAGRGREIAACHGEIVVYGTGWGALENMRRAKAGLPALDDMCRFPEDSMNAEQMPWKALLLENAFPAQAALEIPNAYMNSRVWLEMLEALPEKNSTAWYQLGVMRYGANDAEGAKIAMENSVKAEKNPWALRCLARIDRQNGEWDACIAHYTEALGMGADSYEIAQEYVAALLEAGRAKDALGALDALPEALREAPRFLYLKADACIETGDFAQAEAILLRPLIIPDMREGELSLYSLWQKLYMRRDGISAEEVDVKYPLPYDLDFRMHDTSKK